jgi:hypothetical protein
MAPAEATGYSAHWITGHARPGMTIFTFSPSTKATPPAP